MLTLTFAYANGAIMRSDKGSKFEIEAVASLLLGIPLIAIAAYFLARKDILEYLFQRSPTIGYLIIAQLTLGLFAGFLLVYRHVVYFEGSALLEQPPF